MAKFLCVKGASVLRTTEAPDKHTATNRLHPKSGERVCSEASWKLDSEGPLHGNALCGTCRARYVIGSDVECSFCHKARIEQDEGVPWVDEVPSPVVGSSRDQLIARNKLSWTDAQRRAASDGQKKRYAQQTPEELETWLAKMASAPVRRKREEGIREAFKSRRRANQQREGEQ